MELRTRFPQAVVGGVGLALAGVVLFDVYVDWLSEGKPLWSTVAENAVPLVLALALPYAAWRVARRSYDYRASVARWTAAGFLTMLAVASAVVGFQVLQGELKPRIIVVQTTIVGSVAGLLVGHNTAELRTARNDLAAERDRWQSLFDEDPAAIADVAIVDGVLEVTATNDRFETLGGFEETPAGQRLADVVDPDGEEDLDTVCAHVRDGEAYETETTYRTARGQRHFKLQVVPYGDRRAFLIYQDVTDLTEAQAELEETVRNLEHSNEQLQQFAYVASHDLQEPLRMVSSYVDLLASEYEGELDEEADEYIEFAVDGAERMQDMIDALLQYSRVETRAEEPATVDAGEVFERTRQDLELLVEDAGATVTAGDLPAVRADENQLGQLFQNLVKNAIEHGGEDGAPTVHVDAEDRGEEVAFSVSDDGPGIPTDQQDRVFDIFEKGSRDGDGTGIGLAVCQRIVERHDGDIWVESQPGEGATFAFTLPSAPVEQRASAPESE